MKNTLYVVSVLFLLQSCTENAPAKKINQKPITTEAKQADKLLRHIVMFKFKDDAKTEDIKTVEATFADLKNHIPEIKDFEWGTNNSPEGLNDGLTHCFFVTFADEAGREVYLPHPKHLAFVEILKPHLDKVVVLDYWTE